MRVLLIGSGGREHALAWKLAQSSRLSHLYVAPGNGGTGKGTIPNAHCTIENVPIQADDNAALVTFARENAIKLVIVGPEVPLATGLVDALQAVGIDAFGPSQAAAQLEASKAHAKAFMTRHNIPTARCAVFTEFEAARDHLHSVDYPIVVKASGLAAGKGVIIPETTREAEVALREMMLNHIFDAAGDEVLIEERLTGEEVSLLAFTDGETVRTMPPAQDHKRLLDADKGPNTGGMGAYAPTPACPPQLAEMLTRTVLQPTVDGLRAEGTPLVGILYAGLMLTTDGPRVLEFNCRFGDPEAQVLIPLLDSDLITIAEACVAGRLAEIDVHWKAGAAACVVLAAQGYPGKYVKGHEISGLNDLPENAIIFQAGTMSTGEKVLTNGGRVLGVTGWATTSSAALQTAYAAIEHVSFEGMQYRQDIGWRSR